METAQPMSEMEIADGQIPPWLLDDDGSNGGQISAGTHTPSLVSNRNQYSIPEPDAPSTSRASSRQNQPQLAHTDEPMVEMGVDPLSGAPISTSTPSYNPPVAHTTPPRKTERPRTSKPQRPTMITYKVRPGDNLSLIAARSNTTVSQIMKDSKLTGTTIYPGQTIKVRYTPKGYKPTKGGKGGKGSAAATGGRVHTVTPGQTLSGIAARYGVSTSSLMKANGLNAASARKLMPGRKLKIPAKR